MSISDNSRERRAADKLAKKTAKKIAKQAARREREQRAINRGR